MSPDPTIYGVIALFFHCADLPRSIADTMVERLDAPQVTFPLPPLADIPDQDVDKADEAKRIVNRQPDSSYRLD